MHNLTRYAVSWYKNNKYNKKPTPVDGQWGFKKTKRNKHSKHAENSWNLLPWTSSTQDKCMCMLFDEVILIMLRERISYVLCDGHYSGVETKYVI